MSEGKRILVTGSNGTVGSAIKDAIEKGGALPGEEWIFINRQEADLSDLAATQQLFSRHKPTHVIQLAAKVGGVLQNMKYNLEFFVQNMAISQNVLKCCHENNVERCISVISTCVFPNKITYPIGENMLHNGPPHDSNFGYSYAKRMIDILNRGYAQELGRKYTAVIPCSVYGPNDNFNLEEAHVIPSLMHKIVLAKKNNTPLEVWGSGKALRQFIYTPDLAKLFLWAIRNYEETEPIFLSVGEEEEVSIADIVATIVKYTDFQGEVKFDTTKPEGQFRKPASNAKLRRHLPDFKFTPFEQGIEETVKWSLANYDTARI